MGGWRPRILLLSEPQRGLPDSATGHRDHTEGPPVRQAVLLLSREPEGAETGVLGSLRPRLPSQKRTEARSGHAGKVRGVGAGQVAGSG